jgi:membrane protein YdbS with pleckstrin-like domain
MAQVSLLRLYALRATYLLLIVGLGIDIWPAIIHHEKPWELMQGVVFCVLGPVSALALMGFDIRYRCCLCFSSNWSGSRSG